MNYRFSAFMLGEISFIAGILMCIPLFVAVGLNENAATINGFTISVVISIVLGIVGLLLRPKNKEQRKMNSSSGFVVCGLAWIFICLIGAIPYRISGFIPNYLDSLFETVSGFSTTGASLIPDVESLPMSIKLWRSLTQWIGGMGVLVFVIALLPKNEKMSTAILKAEIPGPQFGKLVSKIKTSSQILYGFYIILTLLLAGILCALKMPAFDSFCHAFTTASTGGFSIMNNSIASYAVVGSPNYLENIVGIEITLTVFMIIFSINFNIFFLVIFSKMWKALKNEEFLGMGIIMLFSAAVITIILCVRNTYSTFTEALRYSSFQVASIMSTTGFDNTPVGSSYNTWPMLAQAILAGLMLTGGCAGSTAGGVKVSRLLIIMRNAFLSVKKTVSPRSVGTVKLNGKPLTDDTTHSITTFFVFYIFTIVVSVMLLSIGSPFGGPAGFITNITAVLASISNLGPSFIFISPEANFTDYGYLAKIVLSIDMLIGRLEVLPIILLFYPKSWKPYQKRKDECKTKKFKKQA